ncbi:hypothetical protein IGJ28_001116 [Enterococcus sp. AZ091]|uniref:lysozyme family protein n=1 Tax=Enterococcus sp. AZ091 TaxID=2774720 RepID=UPI003F25565F
MNPYVVKLLIQYRKPIMQVVIGFFVFIIVSFLLIFNRESIENEGIATDTQNLSAEVLRYKPLVEKYAKQYGGSEYVPYILALMQVESGGRGGDPMQSSESLGLPPNTIQDPVRSIEQGVKFFIQNVKSALAQGVDLHTALQAYNYGGGFIGFVKERGGKYTFELAKEFSKKMALGVTVPYINAISTSMGYSYRYNYGNMFYVPNLLQYVVEDSGGSSVQNNDNNTGSVVLEVPSEYKSKLRYPKYDGHNYNTSGSYPFGQCTWYVFNRMAQIGKRVDDFMGNGGEWGRKGRALGYKVTNTPKVGTAISFPPGSFGSSPVYGHVAFVEVVNPDGTLLISECNVVNPGSGTVSYRVVPKGIAAIASYVEGK